MDIGITDHIATPVDVFVYYIFSVCRAIVIVVQYIQKQHISPTGIVTQRSVRMFSILYQQVVGFQALDFVFLDILMKSLHKLCKIKHRLVTHYNTTVTDLFFNLSVIRRSGEMSV